MGTKVKGLLKGFCQISNIFDAKDQEMQIGFPTDVKHVAHIGWDGPLADASGPKNESQSGSSMPLTGATYGGGNELAVSTKQPSQADSAINGGANTSLPKDSLAKPSKRNTSSNTPNALEAPKQTRRRQPRSDCPSQESSQGSRGGRRERKSSSSSSGSDSSSAVQDGAMLGPTKQPRRKKAAKGSSRSKDGVADRAGLPGPPLEPVNTGAGGGV